MNEPFVDGFGGVGHEYSTFEVGFGEDIRKGSGMVEMETEIGDVSSALVKECMAREIQGQRQHSMGSPTHETFA